MSPTPKTTATKCHKTPTVEKGACAKADKPAPTSAGMIFLFSLPDCETEAYITHDPLFKDVSGLHLDAKFITDDMAEEMTQQIIKKGNPDFKGVRDGDWREFMYSYAECMTRTYENGLTPKATVLSHYYF